MYGESTTNHEARLSACREGLVKRVTPRLSTKECAQSDEGVLAPGGLDGPEVLAFGCIPLTAAAAALGVG